MHSESFPQPGDSPWFLYIIETRGGRLYTGITTDLQRRWQQHLTGRGAKFFRSDPPDRLVYSSGFPDRSTATREELRIKKLSRKKKLELIDSKQATTTILPGV